MALPQSYRAFRRTADTPPTLALATESPPNPLPPHAIVARTHAVSLNYRDVAMLKGFYPLPMKDGTILTSDFAGSVAAVGSEVKGFVVGDRVTATFFVGDDGVGRGGELDGVLAEYGIFEERELVKVPEHLSFEEASTLPCAGVTAWTSLGNLKTLTPESAVLLEGTGGVSMFALLILVAAGIPAIITSSSDDKLASVTKLGPKVYGINYKTDPDLPATVLKLTNGRGVDIIVNNTGASSIPANIECLASGGTAAMVGFLAGFEAKWDPKALGGLIGKRATLKGIQVGFRKDLEELVQFLEEKKVSLEKLIDRSFAFEESLEALEYMASGKHVGKIIIKV